ncbi:ATP-dependent zinc protease family protein [Thalassolituus marinus]|uniref:ATP-dependent zinc protease n=1 Tax=Thalassolituus marinus TaxID=671053 RepID=A0ABS7ZNI7_9GAMM|nr:RimK/LysX family protein [Thalassolituus marinus]MCA6062778.1 ATP-dependent zinc protease [Thalassolituus marinus]
MTKPVLGYIEDISLPDLGVQCLAKVDTGACTSSLHAEQIETFDRDGQLWVRFHVKFDNDEITIDQVCETRVIAQRTIASSNGQRSQRYVIRTRMSACGETFEAEISLSHRGSMRYPMLLGRKAIAGRFLVDVAL